MSISLPYNSEINTIKLGRLFDNMSESYKIFWFQAIVNKVNEGNILISYDSLINEMIADAWYMVSEYKLNLGPSDTLEKVIGLTFNTIGLKSSEKKAEILKALNRSNIPELNESKKILIQHVPYRLQAPFLDDIKGSDWNKKDLTERINNHGELLYYFESINGFNSIIRVNEKFAEYIINNYEIICGWIRYNLVEYLQRRNPSVPGIVNKIDPPQTRNLEKVKKYWKEVIRYTDIHEIYYDETISDKTISIDHFIPWSYVAHDELWNLTPTTRKINSKKSNNLPDWNKYFDKLCKSEYTAYQLNQKSNHIRSLFEECCREHVNDIDIYNKLYIDGLSRDEFHDRLKEIVLPVYKAAHNLGFEEWRNA